MNNHFSKTLYIQFYTVKNIIAIKNLTDKRNKAL